MSRVDHAAVIDARLRRVPFPIITPPRAGPARASISGLWPAPAARTSTDAAARRQTLSDPATASHRRLNESSRRLHQGAAIREPFTTRATAMPSPTTDKALRLPKVPTPCGTTMYHRVESPRIHERPASRPQPGKRGLRPWPWGLEPVSTVSLRYAPLEP